ncbi:MAG: hypothetical protein ACLP9L_27770 [Thermoguttaceae bacterium]
MVRSSFFGRRCNRERIATVLLAVFGVFTCTASALAGGGKVLPPDANPKGYSLWDMAVETAAYNEDSSEPLPKVPFEVLVGGIEDYTVKPGTMLYVPVFYVDNAPPLIISPFPTDLHDQEKDADYLLDIAGEYTGDDITAFFVQVDGKTTILCDDYVVGVKTAPLPDEATRYIVSAAFLSPLTPGEHTVGIGGVIDDEPVVFVSNTVTVKP